MSSHSNLAFDEVPRGDGGTGATEQIARTLRESGVDAPSGLFDEALALAQGGHLSPAAERLRMLLCLDPTDADASLLLGKILASRGQHQESLANLDAAATHGAVLPPGLRERVEVGLRQQIAEAEEHRSRVAARERGEVHTLRAEAKKLRSENAVLELEVDELHRRVRMWSSTTAVIAGVAAALVLAVLLFGGNDAADTEGLAELGESGELVLTPTPESVAATSGETVDQGDVRTLPVDGAAATAKTASLSPSPVGTSSTTSPATSTKTHVVKSGDTLGSIAHRYYGDSSDWPKIQAANKAVLGDGISLKIGMKLSIPAQ